MTVDNDSGWTLADEAMNRKDRRAAGKSANELDRLKAFAADRHGCGDLLAATHAYAKILALAPNLPDIHFNLGLALKGLGRFDDAISAYRRAVALRPGDALAWSNLGNVLLEAGRDLDALAAYRAAVAAQPAYAEAGFNLGTTLLGLGQWDEAASVLRRVVAQRPGWTEAKQALGYGLGHLARILVEAGRDDEAAAICRDAIAVAPELPDCHLVQGFLAFAADAPDLAVECFRRAAALDSTRPEALANLGHALRDLGRLDEALDACRRAQAIAPDYPEAHYNAGMVLLQQGDLAQGWREHEWRWRIANARSRTFPQPAWAGEPLAGRTLLLYGEQGFGDVLQFARFAPVVAALGGRVVLEVQDALAPLTRSLGGGITVIGDSQATPPFDLHAPLLSVPGLLGTTLKTLPADAPYLAVAPELVEDWRGRLPQGGLRVGIVWQGNPRAKADLGRSIPLALFGALAAIPSVRLVSLQKTHGLDQLDRLGGAFEVTRLDNYDQGSFEDTAALIMALDLVVTSDTSVAHLAGALGRPVWILLKHVPDWRWLMGRSDSPWYPTATLFRQAVRGDWASVFAEVAASLRARIEPTAPIG